MATAPDMSASHDQPGAGTREFRVGHTDTSIPQTPSITTHTWTCTRNDQGVLPSQLWALTMMVLGLLGHRHHSGQDCGCLESGTCVCPSVLSSLVAPTGPVLPIPWRALSRSTHYPGAVFRGHVWASGSCTCNMFHVSENRPLCSRVEIGKLKTEFGCREGRQLLLRQAKEAAAD